MCTTAACILKNIYFSASSASEVSLTLVPVDGCRFECQIVRACDEAGPDPNWDRRIHSVPLATRQLVKAETVTSLLSSQI